MKAIVHVQVEKSGTIKFENIWAVVMLLNNHGSSKYNEPVALATLALIRKLNLVLRERKN